MGAPKKADKLSVLVVEDNRADYELMARALKQAFPCSVQLVTSKSEYESHLDAAKPDVIISDSNLITFDGITALGVARNKHPGTLFIFCCGFFSDGILKDASKQGVPCVLKNPAYSNLVHYIKTTLNDKR